MSRLPNQCLPLVVLLSLVGCGFAPGSPEGPTGAAAGSGTGIGSGSGGISGSTGTMGGGLSSGAAGDIGITGAAGTMSCSQVGVGINPLPPDILIVEDRSGSMDNDQNDAMCNNGCGANSKWALITAAINQVVSATDTTVNWGLKFFADMNPQCGVNPGVAVPVAPNSGAAVAAAITGSTKANGGVNNGSYTPTRAAMDAATAYMGTLTDPNPKYILLATDGLPNCPEGCGNGRMSCTTTPNAAETTNVQTAITAAQTAGFKTFVVGIATASDAAANTALDSFAMAGGEPQAAEPYYYSVNNTATLVAALNMIVGKVASCTIDVSKVPASGLANFKISATDSTTGKAVEITDYTFDPPGTGAPPLPVPTSVILDPNGTSCKNLQAGTYTNFAFNYACPGQTICIDNCP